jgi:hypothetical protein
MTAAPGAPEGLRQRVDDALGRNDWASAARGLRELLERTPGHPGLLVQLSYVDSFLGHYRAAHQCALYAGAAPPTGV